MATRGCRLLFEDGSGFLLLEDDSGYLVLENCVVVIQDQFGGWWEPQTFDEIGEDNADTLAIAFAIARRRRRLTVA